MTAVPAPLGVHVPPLTVATNESLLKYENDPLLLELGGTREKGPLTKVLNMEANDPNTGIVRHEMPMLAMLAPDIVPVAFAASHIWPSGWENTETTYWKASASRVENVNAPFELTDTVSVALFCSISVPDAPETVPPTEYRLAGSGAAPFPELNPLLKLGGLE